MGLVERLGRWRGAVSDAGWVDPPVAASAMNDRSRPLLPKTGRDAAPPLIHEPGIGPHILVVNQSQRTDGTLGGEP